MAESSVTPAAPVEAPEAPEPWATPATPETPATTSAPAATTSIAQVAGQVLAETAKAVVAEVSKDITADLKQMEGSLAKEVVSASDDNVSNFVEKVEGAVETVTHEVVEGVKHVVAAVEEHPELIAEGTLAIAVGAASLIQPELIAGEIAIIGKMASDSAKKTVKEIASNEGKKLVQAIAKDVKDDAAAEATKDALQAAEKVKAKAEDVEDIASESNAPPVLQTSNTAETPAAEPTKIQAANTKAIAAAATEMAKATTGDKTIEIQVDQDSPNPVEGSLEVKKEIQPVTLKITIGADGEVKAVAKSTFEKAVAATEEAKESAAVAEESKIDVATAKVETPNTIVIEKFSAVLDKSNKLVAEPKSLEPIPATAETNAPVLQTPKAMATKEAPKDTEREAEKRKENLPLNIEEVEPEPSKKSKKKEKTSNKQSPPSIETKKTKSEASAKEVPVMAKAAEPEEHPAEVKGEQSSEEESEKSGVAAPVGVITAEQPKPVEVVKEAPKAGESKPAEKKVPDEEASKADEHKDHSWVEESILERQDHQEAPKSVGKSIHFENAEEAIEFKELSESASKAEKAAIKVEFEPREEVAEPKVEEAMTAPEISEQPVETVKSVETSVEPEITSATPVDEEPKTPLTTKRIRASTNEGMWLAGKISSPKKAKIEQEPVSESMALEPELAAESKTRTSDFSPDIPQTIKTASADISSASKPTFNDDAKDAKSGVAMVTIPKESLDHLHIKLDAMHDAIQQITRTLATHLPQSTTAATPVSAPSNELPAASAPNEAEPVVSPVTFTSEQSTSSEVPTMVEIPVPAAETTVSKQPQNTPEPLIAASPKREKNHRKRGSVFSFLWPFGGTAPVKEGGAESTPGNTEASTPKKDDESAIEVPKDATTTSEVGPVPEASAGAV